MAIDFIKYPKPGSITFTDGDTDFIVTSDKVSPSDAVVVTGDITLWHFDPAGQQLQTTLAVNFPVFQQGWGVNLAGVVRNFFSRVDIGRAGQCFYQECCVLIRDITFSFTDGQGVKLDSGGTGLYLATLVNDPLQHGYTDIYRQDKFLHLTSYCQVQTNGYFAFSYMQSISEKTSVFLVYPDGTEELLVNFNPDNYSICYYNVAGHFTGPAARVEVRSDTGAVLAFMEMEARRIESYDEHLLYLSSSIGTPELFVCTGRKSINMEVKTDVFELLRYSVATTSTASKSVTINTGYLSRDEYDRFVSLLPSLHECSLDGQVCWVTGGDFSFIDGQKNNVSVITRLKWN